MTRKTATLLGVSSVPALSTVGYALSNNEFLFTSVRYVLEKEKFVVLSDLKYDGNKSCNDALRTWFKGFDSKEYKEARQYCTKPKTLHQIAKERNLVVIMDKDTEEDGYWAVKTSDYNQNYDRDWDTLKDSYSESNSSTSSPRAPMEGKTLTAEIFEKISELKNDCLALAFQNTRDSGEDRAWPVFVKYCTRIKEMPKLSSSVKQNS